MPSPINTYDSDINLNLGQVPQVDDPELYRALLDLHNAIEALATYIDIGDTGFIEFLAKFRSVKKVNADYEVQLTDGLILVDASAGSVIVTLPASELGKGYRYSVKVIAWTSPNTVTVIGATIAGVPELIDDRSNGIKVSNKSSYTFISVATDSDPSLKGYAIT